MGKLDDQIKAAQERAKREFDRAEEERKREMLKRRITIANDGVRAFEGKQFAEANRLFQTYLGVLEHWKKVPEGGLHPGLFDRKSEITEILLISGVYWDLVMLYDHSKGKEAQFHHFLSKYLLFAKGMPFQTMCAEALRKYISRGNAIHKSAMKDTYKKLSKTRCFVATTLVDVISEKATFSLWAVRDEVLEKHIWGRAFIKAYYAFGPFVAWVLDHCPVWVRTRTARLLERSMVKLLGDF